MRFLIDENVSWRVAELPTKTGHDAVHVRDLDAEGIPDSDVMALAVRDDRIIISADTDFGALLAHTRATKPSVILVRALIDRRPPELVGSIIVANLDTIREHLDAGAIAAFTQDGIRVRPLPLR
jgi:predicted nuclease of predicted toxin-antitoxin system